MTSWFDKIRDKMATDKMATDNMSEQQGPEIDEELKKKQDQLNNTLQKLNTDDVLYSDEIVQMSLSLRSVIKNPVIDNLGGSSNKESPSMSTKATSKSVSIEKPPMDKPEVNEPEIENKVKITDDDERYGAQFWD